MRYDDFLSRSSSAVRGLDDAQLGGDVEFMDDGLRETVNAAAPHVVDSSDDSEDDQGDPAFRASVRVQLDSETRRLEGSGEPDTEAEAAARSASLLA